MSNRETAAHLRAWCAQPSHGAFEWPTDACGYDQHIRFVEHRGDNWSGGTKEEWTAFVLAYAESLEGGDS